MARRPLIAGNWKMNGLAASITLLDKIIAGAANLPATVDILVCPPFTLLAAFAAIVTPKLPVPIPAISPPRCWPMPRQIS
jgi:triosephosphate isomerase